MKRTQIDTEVIMGKEVKQIVSEELNGDVHRPSKRPLRLKNISISETEAKKET